MVMKRNGLNITLRLFKNERKLFVEFLQTRVGQKRAHPPSQPNEIDSGSQRQKVDRSEDEPMRSSLIDYPSDETLQVSTTNLMSVFNDLVRVNNGQIIESSTSTQKIDHTAE